MATSISMRADYGLDAPLVIRNLTITGIASIVAGLVLHFVLIPVQSVIATIVLNWGIFGGASLLVTAALMVWSSKVGKLRERERLIDTLALRGDEIVADIGCGHGLLLIAAARRLVTGRAVGLDLWQSVDQSGNHPEAILANAQAEGVAGRIEIKTGDMRELPFADGTIDVAVSSLAIHNVPDKKGRAKAIQEIARVLKPTGRVALLDFKCTDEYARTLREMGWREVELSALRFWMFPPVRVVFGRKPA